MEHTTRSTFSLYAAPFVPAHLREENNIENGDGENGIKTPQTPSNANVQNRSFGTPLSPSFFNANAPSLGQGFLTPVKPRVLSQAPRQLLGSFSEDENNENYTPSNILRAQTQRMSTPTVEKVVALTTPSSPKTPQKQLDQPIIDTRAQEVAIAIAEIPVTPIPLKNVNVQQEESEQAVNDENQSPLKTPVKSVEVVAEVEDLDDNIEITPPAPRIEILPGLDFPYTLDRRVARWNDITLKIPLDQVRFPDYRTASLQHQKLMSIMHGFSVIADRFYNIGILRQRDLPNTHLKELEYLVVTELAIGKQSPQRGVTVWTVDPRNICFHKFFHINDQRDFVKELMRKTFSKVDFPALGTVLRPTRQPNNELTTADGERVAVDPTGELIKIVNPRLNVRVTLYKNIDL